MVGLSRTSIGPAISVIDSGVAGFLSSDMTATAASPAHRAGRPRGYAPGPMIEEADHVVDIVLDPNQPAETGTSRAFTQSVI